MIKIVFWAVGRSETKNAYINALTGTVHVISTTVEKYRPGITVFNAAWIHHSNERRSIGNWDAAIIDDAIEASRGNETIIVRNLHEIFNAIIEEERENNAIPGKGLTDDARIATAMAIEQRCRDFLQELGKIEANIILFYNVMLKTGPGVSGAFHMNMYRLVDAIEFAWLEDVS
jgi:hypothetical protein